MDRLIGEKTVIFFFPRQINLKLHEEITIMGHQSANSVQDRGARYGFKKRDNKEKNG
jgi:hypothetical protein